MKRGKSPIPKGATTRAFEYLRKHFKVNPFRQSKKEITKVINQKIHSMEQVSKGQKTLKGVSKASAARKLQEYKAFKSNTWQSRANFYSRIRSDLKPQAHAVRAYTKQGKTISGYTKIRSKWTADERRELASHINMPTGRLTSHMQKVFPESPMTYSRVATMKHRMRHG